MRFVRANLDASAYADATDIPPYIQIKTALGKMLGKYIQFAKQFELFYETFEIELPN